MTTRLALTLAVVACAAAAPLPGAGQGVAGLDPQALVEAFREARAPRPPADVAAGASPAARCDALAGGPAAGFGTSDPVSFRDLRPVAAEAAAACEEAAAAEPDAPRHPFHLGRARLATGDAAAAMDAFGRAAGAGHPPALNAMGVAHLRGEGVVADRDRALELFALSAGEGYPPAMVNRALGLVHSGVARGDHVEALGLFLQAAEAGDPVAPTQAAILLHEGYGAPRDVDEATRLLRLGASRGDPEAIHRVSGRLNLATPDIVEAGRAAGHRGAALISALYLGGDPSGAAEALRGPGVHADWEDGLLYLPMAAPLDMETHLLALLHSAGFEGGPPAALREPLFQALADRAGCTADRLHAASRLHLGCAP
jgi:TPR repeat protein